MQSYHISPRRHVCRPVCVFGVPALLLACLVVVGLWLTPAAFADESTPLDDNYPPDLTHDIVWNGGSTLADVIANFNRARRQENAQLGTFLADMPTPSAATWNAMVEAERALWLINQERTARGIAPLHGLEQNVTQVAQAYADWLLANNKFGHFADEKSPTQRLNENAAIAACHDFLGVSENLWWRGTTNAAGVAVPVERAVYEWLYADAGAAWSHRHAILWKSFTENSGPGDREGFLGIGHARGDYITQTDNGPLRLPYTDMVVMNVFDPCATWAYAAPPAPPPPPAPQPEPAPQPAPNTHKVSGAVMPPRWVTIASQNFEVGSWPGAWQTTDGNGPENGHYTWIAATCRVFAGTYSGMAVGGGADGGVLGCGDLYPNMASSWLMYGPFSLQDAIAAEMNANVWVYTEPNHDMLCMLASLDRKMFHGPCVSGYSGAGGSETGWVGETFDLHKVYRLGSLLGKSQVYVAFAFVSDENGSLPHMGAYADNIVLQKAIREPAQAADAAVSAAPIAGVTVRSHQGPQTMTGQDGAFVLAGLVPGQHILTFDLDGYTFYPGQMTLNVNRDLSGVSVVGITSERHWAYLPTVLRRTPRVSTAAASGLVVANYTFRLECVETQCRLVGPLD